jgi:hypothetical protein
MTSPQTSSRTRCSRWQLGACFAAATFLRRDPLPVIDEVMGHASGRRDQGPAVARISGPPPTHLADLPRLEARAPDIQAALTVLGRLVGQEEDMAAAVDRLQLFDTDLRGAFLVGANLQAALLGGAHLKGPS